MVRSVNIRKLKDELSAYLRLVRAGDVVLVTDRGTVVAELRPPLCAPNEDRTAAALRLLADAGELVPGRPNDDPGLYKQSAARASSARIDAALEWTRGEG